MKRITQITLATVLLIVGYFIYLLPSNVVIKELTVEATHPGWFKQYLELKGDQNGDIPKGLHALWYKADKQNIVYAKKDQNNLTNITELGPNNVGGRNRALVVDHSNSNKFLCAAVSGGIWVTNNAGSSWDKVNDFAPSLSATCLTQSPFDADVYYYGTGESAGNSASIDGIGLFRSRDGASTFEHLEHTMISPLIGIWDVEHSLTKDSTVYVGTNDGGLYRTTDGGATFEQILSTNGLAVYEIEVFDDSTIMAAVNGYGIVKIHEETLESTRMIGGNWPTGTYSRISFDYCKDYPNVLFAQVATSNLTDLVGIYKSSNRGETWTQISTPSTVSYSQAWYDFKLSVAPSDSNFAITGAVTCAYTTNGGSSWLSMVNPHSDYHELTWIDDNNFLVGNDGGVYRMNKNSMSTFTTLNRGLNITQFYAGHYYPSGNRTIGGTQDNGTRFGLGTTQAFSNINSGDGAFCAVNQQNDAVRYVSSQNLNMRRQETGVTSVKISNKIRESVDGDRGVWFINPFEINNLDGDQLYVPTKGPVFRSTNAGTSWLALTPNLIGDTYSVGLSNDENPTLYIGGTISRLYRIDNAATAVTGSEVDLWSTRYRDFLGSTIGCIEVDPTDKSRIYCGLTNISEKSRIWRVDKADTDAETAIWTDLSSNLPSELPVNWIEVDPDFPDHILIATDFGLYTSLNGGYSWNKEERVPNVAIDQIRLRHSDRKLFIYTHGRGIWSADLLDNLVAKVDEQKTERLNIYPNPASKYINVPSKVSMSTIYNHSGQQVATSDASRIDISSLEEGVYFVSMQVGKSTQVKKIIIAH